MSGLGEDVSVDNSRAREIRAPESVGARSMPCGWYLFSVATVRDGKSPRIPITAVATQRYQDISPDGSVAGIYWRRHKYVLRQIWSE